MCINVFFTMYLLFWILKQSFTSTCQITDTFSINVYLKTATECGYPVMEQKYNWTFYKYALVLQLFWDIQYIPYLSTAIFVLHCPLRVWYVYSNLQGQFVRVYVDQNCSETDPMCVVIYIYIYIF